VVAKPRLYDSFILDHIKNARNYRRLGGGARAASGSNPLCGDEMTVFLRVDDGKIAEISFQCSCCGIAMASASMMTEHIAGKSLDQARDAVSAFTALLHNARPDCGGAPDSGVRRLAEILQRYPGRLSCAVLGWTALGGIIGAEALSGSG